MLAAFDLPNRVSTVSADTVYRIGYVPRRVDRYETVGRKRRQRGGKGSLGSYTTTFKKPALQQYMTALGMNPVKKSNKSMAQALSSSKVATVEDLNKRIETGEIEGDKANLYTLRALANLESAAPAPEAKKQLFPAASEKEFSEARKKLKQTLQQEPPVNAPEPESKAVVSTPSPPKQSESHKREQQELLEAADELRESIPLFDEVRVPAHPGEENKDIRAAIGTSSVLLAHQDVVRTRPELSEASKAVAQSQLQHVFDTTSNQSAKEAAEQGLSALGNESPLLGKHQETLQNVDIMGRESRKLTSTPAKVQKTPPTEAFQTPGAAARRDTPASQQSTPTAQPSLANVVMDPQFLSAVDRIGDRLGRTERLLATMTRNQRDAFQDLDDRAQQLLVTDRQLDADELPSVMQHLRDYPEVAKLMEQGLVKPEQLKDTEYVAELAKSLRTQQYEGRSESMRGRIRASNAPVLERTSESKRSGLVYYKRPRHVRPSIFAGE